MSARLEPLLFHKMTRCHSVFSCFSPAWFFHWRLVATDRVATREPFEVLRTSGSAPRFPIRIALFRLRLTCTSWMLTWGHDRGPGESVDLARSAVNQTRAPGGEIARGRAASRPLCHRQSQHQRVLARVAVVRAALTDGAEAVTQIERLGRQVGLAHLEKHFVDSPVPKRGEAGAQQRASDATPTGLGCHRQVQYLPRTRHLAPDEIPRHAAAGVGDQTERPR